MLSTPVFSPVLLVVVMLFSSTPASSSELPTFAESKQRESSCEDRCGNVSIPFPFGTREGCYLDKKFLIRCNNSYSPPQAFLWESNIRLTNISLEGQLTAVHYVSKICYYPNGTDYNSTEGLTRLAYNMVFNSTANKFFAVGCDTSSLVLVGIEDQPYWTGCNSYCENTIHIPNGTCSGIGCCQTSIPSGASRLTTKLGSYYNHTNVSKFNPCSYAFVAEERAFNFSVANLTNFAAKKLPVILDWTVGNGTCKKAKRNVTSFACKYQNSECFEPRGGTLGYRCSCKKGFIGNPYLPDGCQDIDECQSPDSNNCATDSVCENSQGNYTCSCKDGYHGDGRKDGKGCMANQGKQYIIIAGVASTIAFLVAVSSYLHFEYRRRKLIRLKEKFFRENGGLILQQELLGRDGSNKTVRIFTAEELKRATNNYDQNLIIGQGGFGTVYKGVLSNNRIVAIKKSKIVDRSQTEQFINEVLVLSQINHRNVVKLLGCCLETEVPLLVYEFINNGTLHEHIHEPNKARVLSWDTRLRIAAETAGALFYLHSAASPPIIHRDVKCANILLDGNCNAKVSDFGASRLIPLEEMQLSTLVQGTLGYLDPEYLQTSQLTEKSDVYSFGVVLAELLTSKKPRAVDGQAEERYLAKHFLSSTEDDKLFQILDQDIICNSNTQQLKEVALLAKKCLNMRGDDRPSMKEMAMVLKI